MAELRNEKYVSSLPGVLIANTIYYVKNGLGFDMYLTNDSGIIVAYPLNTDTSNWNTLDLIVPFPAVNEYTIEVIDPQVLLSSNIDIQWRIMEHENENTPEMSDITFTIMYVYGGGFNLVLSSNNGQSTIGGLYKLRYKIN